MSMRKRGDGRGLFSFLTIIIFGASVIFALVTFGYKFYLENRINQMGGSLEQALTTIQPEPEAIRQMIRFDNRIVSTHELIAQHRILSPLFEFLEASTPSTVRFTDFQYVLSEHGLQLTMRGEARGYSALALQADIFSKSESFKDPIFSDLNLNAKGDVTFSFRATVDPTLVLYQRKMERIAPPVTQGIVESVATSTGPASSPQAATTTSTSSGQTIPTN